MTGDGASAAGDRAIVDPFGMKPLRPGARVHIHQTGKKTNAPPATKRRDRRYFCDFVVGAKGRARWNGRAYPSKATFKKVQLLIDRRFCGERLG
jgi:hypothetical protein